MEFSCRFILSVNLKNILIAEFYLVVWPDFIVLIAIKIRSLHLVAREERFVQVAQDEGLQILPNIYWKKSFQKSQ
jgi:hypothetical protein